MTAVIVLFEPNMKGIKSVVCKKRTASATADDNDDGDNTVTENAVKRIKTDLVESSSVIQSNMDTGDDDKKSAS